MHGLLRWVTAGVLGGALLSASPAGAAIVPAPGFEGGPRITRAGLVWEDSVAHLLTPPEGATMQLQGGDSQTIFSASSYWQVVTRFGRVQAGLLGGPLKVVPVLRRCPPLSDASGLPPNTPAPALLALSGTMLYAVVDPSCLHAPGYGHRALLAASLRSGAWRLVAPVSPGVAGLASSGPRLAVTYLPHNEAPASPPDEVVDEAPPAPRDVEVDVLDLKSSRSVYRVSVPVHPRSATSLTTQVDEAGDVLVISTFGPVPKFEDSGWWATPTDPVAHELRALDAGKEALKPITFPNAPSAHPEPIITYTAALSGRRLAYLRDGPGAGEEQIDVLDLRSGTTRPLVYLRGVAGALSLDLGGNELAWAQQSTMWEVGSRPSLAGGVIESCRQVAVSPVQLERLDLAPYPAGPLVVGAPLPADQPTCKLLVQ